MRGFAAVPIAIAVCLATPAFADASTHVTAAKKAEKKRDWRKALQEWKAAYAAEPNAEYLIGIGDAQAHLGNKAEAKKNYEAYLADPLALPKNAEKVRARLAKLDAPANDALALTLPGAAAAAPKSEPLPLPGLDLPAAAPAKSAAADKGAPSAVPGLDLAAAPAAKKEPDKVASASAKKEPDRAAATALVLPLPGAAVKPEATTPGKTAPAVASKDAGKPPQAKVAVATPPPAPVAAVSATPIPTREGQGQGGTSSVQRTMAYVTAGVAVAALGGGVLAFTKASSAHDDLTGSVHSGAQAQQLLGDEQRYRTLSFVGLAGGLVAAGIATALFAF
jgi:hypothetical protein